MAGGREEYDEREGCDHREIEEDRGGSGGSEARERVENAAIEGHERDKQEIWKGDPRELDRQREAAGIGGKSRRQQRDHGGRENERNRQQDHLAREQQREHAIGEASCGIGAALLANARIGGHEGGIEGTFGEDGAEMVGQPQRDEKGIGNRAGAEHGGQHDIARKAGDTRQSRQAADGEDAP